MVTEEATVFECFGEQLVEIVHWLQGPKEAGVIVGGSQYRVSSHLYAVSSSWTK